MTKKRYLKWEKQGIKLNIADINNTKELKKIFNKGERLFLLNPPGNITKNTIEEERKTLKSIFEALKNSSIKNIVAQSTYGAQEVEGKGDLSTLYEMEQALAKQEIPYQVIRAAYFMSNWDNSLETAIKEGKVYTFFPVDFNLPMVAPSDIAHLAAKLLNKPLDSSGLHYIEGPKQYNSKDVANAFAKALNKPVETVQIKPENWLNTLKKVGFSEESAQAMFNMTKSVLEEDLISPDNPVHGTITIDDYIADLVEEQVHDDV